MAAVAFDNCEKDRGVIAMKKKPIGLKYSTMNNYYVKGQRVQSKKYKENYDKIKWDTNNELSIRDTKVTTGSGTGAQA